MHSSVDAVHYPLPSLGGTSTVVESQWCLCSALPCWSRSATVVVLCTSTQPRHNGAPVHGTTSSLLRLPVNQGGDSPGPAWGIPSLGQPNMEKDCEEAPLSPEAPTVYGTRAEA